jgi:3-oxoacyl-[acyl-carrier protein] reductase
MSKALAGKAALVTGAGKNIGRSIALALAADGAAVGVNTKSSRAEAEDVVREIRDAGGQAELCMADIADGAAVKAMVESVAQRFGRLDLLILNASYRREVPFVDMTFDEWRNVMSISLDGSFHCVKNALPHMLRAGGGRIVILGGANALSGAAKRVHNSVAKNGLVGMTRALAKELAPHGICVNCVSPGPIDTSRPAHRAAHSTRAGSVPLGRMGKPEEIAAMVHFLCGPGGDFITGQVMHVNGGTLLGA